MSKTELKPCPLCGAKAFVHHDIVDGFDFGWSVGCPRACIGDRIHGLNDRESFEKARITMYYLPSREKAVKKWNERATEVNRNERSKNTHGTEPQIKTELQAREQGDGQ